MYQGKILTPVIKTIWGYYGVNLYDMGRVETHYIHRLVANAFLPNPDKKPEIDHIDRVKGNNTLANLRWVSCRENCANRKKRK